MKKHSLVIFIVILSAIIVSFLVVTNLNLGFLIPRLEDYAKEKWQQDITIKRAGITFYKGFCLKIEDIHWRNDAPTKITAELKEFYLELRLRSLFRGVIHISDITLQHPTIVITQTKAKPSTALPPGAKPLTEISAPKAQKKELIGSQAREETMKTRTPKLFPQNLDIGSLSIREGTVVYEDESGGEKKRMILERINVRIKRAAEEKVYNLKGSTHFESIPVSLAGSLGPLDAAEGDITKVPFRIEITADNLLLKVLQTAFPRSVHAMDKVKISGPETFTFVVEGTPEDFKVNFLEITTQQRIQIDRWFLKEPDITSEVRLSGQFKEENKFVFDKVELNLDQFSLKSSGEIILDGKPQARFDVEVPLFSIASLKNIFPPLAPWKLGGELSLKILSNTQKNFALPIETQGQVIANSLRVQPPNFQAPLEADKLLIQISPQEVTLPQTLFQWAEGTIRVQGSLQDYWKIPRFELKGDLEQLTLSSFLPPNPPKRISIDGTCSGTYDFTGSITPGKPQHETVDGKFDITIQDGQITNFNFLRKLDFLNEIAGPASKLPFLSGILSEALGKRIFSANSSPNTEFVMGHVVGEIHNGLVSVSDLTLSAPNFDAAGKGEYHLTTQRLKLIGRLILSYENTQSLISRIPEFEKLKDQKGRVTLYFNLEGKGQDIKVVLLKELVWDALHNLIVKPGKDILVMTPKPPLPGGGQESENEAPLPQEETKPTAPEKEPDMHALDDLINYGLNKILGKKDIESSEDPKS